MKLGLIAASIVLVGGSLLAACGSDDNATSSGDGVTVSAPWARTSPAAATMGAAYMTLESKQGDTLESVAVPASVAKAAQIHETTMAGSSDTTMAGSDTTMGSGEMTMKEIDSLELPAGKAVTLAPGGYHVMLVDLAAPLKVGSSIELTLTFAKAGEQTVSVPVRDSAP